MTGSRATAGSRRRFQFGIEVGNDVLESRDRLLNRGNMDQFPAADRTVAVLQRDNQVSPLLLAEPAVNRGQAVFSSWYSNPWL